MSGLALAAMTRLQRAQPERKVTVVIQEGLMDDGDPRLLALVFDNLLGNAWKFSSRREHAVIEVGSEPQPGREPVYYVRDNGVGFDMRYAGKLFAPFQRLHLRSDFDGLGMGLATVHRVVGRHGGRVWALGALDQGATFRFTLA